MSQAVLTLELPAEVYDHLRRAAKGMRQPVETALVNIVKAATPSLEKVPPAYRAELEAMEDLPDDALWKAARRTVRPVQERELARLLDKNQRTQLTERERRRLDNLRSTADRVMLRRSYAYLLLKYRGHPHASPCLPSAARLAAGADAGRGDSRDARGRAGAGRLGDR